MLTFLRNVISCRKCLFVTICLLPAVLAAQNQPIAKVDSLLQLLSIMKDDTNKVNLLHTISQIYESGYGKEKAISKASQELELARRLGWIKGQVKGLWSLGAAYVINGNYQKYFVYIKEAYELAKKNRLTDWQYRLQSRLSFAYEYNKNYEPALSNARDVLEYYLKFRPKDVNISEGFNGYYNIWIEPAYDIGRIYSAMKNDSAAMELYQQLLSRFIKENDSLGIRTALNLLRVYSYEFLQNYDNSREYGFKELKYFRKGDTSTTYAYVITDIANTYRLQKNYVKALVYYRMAIELNPDASIVIKNSANSGMRLIYFFLGDYNKALALDLAQLSDASRTNNASTKLALYDNIAEDYTNLKQYDQSLLYLKKELKLSDSIYEADLKAEILVSFANLYYLTHRYDEALLKIRESTRTIYFKKDKWSQNLNLLYKGKIIREAPDSVLRKYGILPGKKYQESATSLRKAVIYFTSYNSNLGYFTSHNSISYLEDCYKELSTTYESMKNYSNFYSTYKKYIALRDSSVNRDNQNAFISKLADLQFEKKEDSLNYQQSLTNDKLKQQTQLTVQQRRYYLSGIIALLIISFFIARNYYNQRRLNRLLTAANDQITQANQEITTANQQITVANQQITAEKQRSDNLLLNILPADIAEELKEKGSASARLFDHVTVLFTDFVNFTTISEMLTPQELVDELHYCFKAFDEISSKYGIEKIKTIGDAYLAVAGLPYADPQHALNTVEAALEIQQFIQGRKLRKGNKSFDIRIGIHSGSVVAGIVGVKKFAYDIWGDTVNTAARMEQHSMPGQINVSEKTFELVKDEFVFAYRGEIEAKNKGAMKMYFVEKQAAQVSISST